MNNYLLIEPDLVVVAEKSIGVIQQRFNTRKVKIEQPFNSKINYKPTLHWKTKTHIIVCEIASSPFPNSVRELFSEVSVKGLPVKLFISYPANRQNDIRKYREEVKKAKEYGIGLISLNDNNEVEIENLGVSISSHIPQISISHYKKNLRNSIEDAYSVYINGNPRHGSQELGQVIEQIIRNIAIEAKRKGHYNNGVDPNLPQSAFASILDDLIRNSILKQTYLNRVRAYTEDRNSVSHRVNSLKKSREIEGKLKLNFMTGLRILEETPAFFKEGKNGYRYKVKLV